MTDHEHKNVKSYPTLDYGRYGVSTEECECGERRETDPWTGEWGSWGKGAE